MAAEEEHGNGPIPVPELVDSPLWKRAADGLVLVGSSGTIRATNAELERCFGYDPGELVGEPLEVLLPSNVRDRHVEHRRSYDARPWDRAMLDGNHFKGLRSDSTVFPVTVGLSRVETDEGDMTVAAVRDSTEREHVETELALAHRRSLLAEEHDRIASDLHDSVVQRLFALGLGLDRIAAQADDDIAAALSEAVDRIDDTIGDIRDAIYGLHSATDDDDATSHRLLDVIVESRNALGFLPEVVLASGVDDIDDAVLVEHLRKVLREALSNVARHAQASSARVEVSTLDTSVVLVVEDDGIGLGDPETTGLGLAGMRRRAEGLGGAFSVEDVRPHGTRVRWSAPPAAHRSL